VTPEWIHGFSPKPHESKPLMRLISIYILGVFPLAANFNKKVSLCPTDSFSGPSIEATREKILIQKQSNISITKSETLAKLKRHQHPFLLLITIITSLGIGYIINSSFTSTGVPAMSTVNQSVARTVKKVVKGTKLMEGAGVRICRTVGTPALKNLDPFLMLDELKLPSDQATAGFPDHPHRGFETCSIMLNGKMEHRDSAGNHGVLTDGGVQYMTAGRGIVHSEMPVVTTGMLHGFQLWINLPARDKMIKPRYQDYQAADIPSAQPSEGASVRVMAGEVAGVKGPIEIRNPSNLLDVRLQPGASFEHALPDREWAGFCYVYEGHGTIGGKEAMPEHALVLDHDGDIVKAVASNEEGSGGLKFLLIAGQPIKEEIVQYGPFVMNSQLEIMQAFADYRDGKLQNPDDKVWEAWGEEL